MEKVRLLSQVWKKRHNFHQCDESYNTATLKMLSSCNQCGGKDTFGIKLKTHSIKLYVK